MADPKRGLGRGLSALLGDASVSASNAPGPDSGGSAVPNALPIELLRRNPDQPRRHFTEDELEALTASIREVGVIQPLLVRPAPGAEGEYQIVAGERRWRAAQRAGLDQLPVVVRSLTDLEVLEIGIIENIQREDLRPLDEAKAYKALIERFGRTQDAIAQTVGKSRSHVANMMRLLALPPEIQSMLDEAELSAGHARALLSSGRAVELAQQTVLKGLSVRQLEQLVRNEANQAAGSAVSAAPARVDPDIQSLERDLSDVLGLSVRLKDRSGAGELRIAYKSIEQLDEVCRRLSRP